MTDDEKKEIVEEVLKSLEINIETKYVSDYYSKHIEVKIQLIHNGSVFSEAKAELPAPE
jgi:hypothetical protein